MSKKQSIWAKEQHQINPNFAMKGKHHSEETKKKMSIWQIGTKRPKQSIRMKGNTYFKGKKHSKKTIQLMKEKQRGKIISIKQRKQISKTLKGKKPWNTGKKNIYSKQLIQRKKILRQQQILNNGYTTNLGKNEKRILDEIELSLNKKINRQFILDGYFIDGYCKSLNLVIEVDEKYHINNKERDKYRQKYVQNKLNCDFIRIKDF